VSYQAVKWALNVKTGSIARKAVLLVIAEYADKNGVNSFPDQETIAAQAETSTDSVQRHVNKMVDAGIISRERRHDPKTGHRMSDSYSLDLNRIAYGLGQDRKACGVGDGVLNRKSGGSYTATSPEPKPQSCGVDIESTLRTTKEPPKKDSLPDDGAAFEEWWRHYPKKVGKDAARKAYSQATRNGATAAALLQGAMRYAAERDGKDPHYTKHPSGWLNAGRWKDEPTASGAGSTGFLGSITRGCDMVPDDDAEISP
jgi:hypothetical protein